MHERLRIIVAILLVGCLLLLQAVTDPAETVAQVTGTCAHQPHSQFRVSVSGYLVVAIASPSPSGPHSVMSWGTLWSSREAMTKDEPGTAIGLISFGNTHVSVSMSAATSRVTISGTIRCSGGASMTANEATTS